MRDIEGKELTVGCKVIYAVNSGGSAGTLRVATILDMNPKTDRVKVEIQGDLSEWERRIFSTPFREDKFFVVDVPSSK